MTLLLVLIGVLILFIFGSLLLVMFVFSQAKPIAPEKAGESEEPETIKPKPFLWKAVILPLVVLVMVAAMVLVFYGRLPEEVALNFASDGTPGSLTTKGTLIMWALLPQILLTLVAFLIAWGVTRVGMLTRSAEDAGIKMENVLTVMGNMLALPQLILGFAMLNTFGYNAYETRLVPLWTVVLIIAISGAVVLGVFFITTIRQVWNKGNK